MVSFLVMGNDVAAGGVSGTAVPLLQVLGSEARHVFRPGLKNSMQQRRYHGIHLTTTIIVGGEVDAHGMIRKKQR